MAHTPRNGKIKEGQPALAVEIDHFPAPDADERLRRAFALVLLAAARADSEVAKDGESTQDGQQGGLDDGQ